MGPKVRSVSRISRSIERLMFSKRLAQHTMALRLSSCDQVLSSACYSRRDRFFVRTACFTIAYQGVWRVFLTIIHDDSNEGVYRLLPLSRLPYIPSQAMHVVVAARSSTSPLHFSKARTPHSPPPVAEIACTSPPPSFLSPVATRQALLETIPVCAVESHQGRL